MLCPCSIASVLLFGSPATPTGAIDDATGAPAELPADVATPLRDGVEAPPPSVRWLPQGGAAPLSPPALRQSPHPPPATALPSDGAAPLSAWAQHHSPYPPPAPRPPGDAAPPYPPPAGATSSPTAPLVRPAADADRSRTIAAPFGRGPTLPVVRIDPRQQRVVRIELLIGPVWRVRTTELMSQASVEVGRLQGFSGTGHGGVIVAPDRDFIAAADFPIGAGFVYRRRLGERSLHGSVGVSAGLLVHRAATERGVIHRVDPDIQVPLRFAWTAGEVGFSVALLQGFSGRGRTYSRRGAEVWSRIPYRIGFVVGIHFDVGLKRTRSRRAARGSRGLP